MKSLIPMFSVSGIFRQQLWDRLERYETSFMQILRGSFLVFFLSIYNLNYDRI